MPPPDPEADSRRGPAGPSGYRHPGYAQSLAEFGTPRFLPRSGGWLLERSIGELPYRDAMGCYPLFSCSDWSALRADLLDLAPDLVCVSLVADPFGDYRVEDLERDFADKFFPFKAHFVAELGRPPREFVSAHHRYYARRALSSVEVERCERPLDLLEDWSVLYAHLVERHRVSGLKAFSRLAFERQLAVPGMVALRARHQGRTVAAHLWYLQDEVAYSHLAATSDLGYRLMAPYALHWSALETFASEARWLNLAGAAGLSDRATDGLARFKRGWSTGTRTAYFCGRIFDRRRYDEALTARRQAPSDYFPAYRRGELG
jgi:hypothetical protein